MKTKLLSLLLTTVLFTSAMNAQTTFDFGAWPDSPGYYDNIVVSNLGITGPPAPVSPATATPIGINESVTAVNFTGFTGTKRFKMGGNSVVTGNLPSRYFVYVAASGAGNIKVFFKGGNSSTTRTITVSDGTNIIGTAASVNGASTILDANYSSVNGGILYIYNDLPCNLYGIRITGTVGTTTLGNDNFQPVSSLNIVAANKQVNITNVISSTEVNVYNMTGALVKTLKIDADTTFDLPNSGLYVVNVKSAEGEKSVKVAIK